MNIDQVFKEAGDKSIALVRDGAIFYLVLNRPENVFDFDTIAAINACLDEVEKSTGAACLVTIGSGDKVFSTGFNLKFWATGVIPQFQSIVLIQEMFDRMLTIGVPTLCVMNGMTIAGGLLFALMHDFRIMKDDPKCFTCLSEINVGLSLTPAFGAMVKYQLDPQASRLMMFGGRFGPQDSLKLRVADSKNGLRRWHQRLLIGQPLRT
ncbi:hypothetical protein FGO68_gene933 [Halteria grandinella]|uniref:Enoyl-CoA hydratase/isomerase n=1 Tax=Halteria grandinella TaxID=5974 RepID=A0A8J8SZ40_HALGN|nr:hypothetical protein FGO68_gene933 [Halteria grandinella]